MISPNKNYLDLKLLQVIKCHNYLREEAMWLQKQGEVVSTVERIHTMQNEIQNYK